jgi:hypothetical protein
LQGANGTVKAVGNGYWDYKNVSVTWSASEPNSSGSGGLSPSMRSLAIALPVVFGTLMIGGVLGYFCWRKRRYRQGVPAYAVQEPLGKAGGVEGVHDRGSMGVGEDANGPSGSGSTDKVEDMQQWNVEKGISGDGSTGGGSQSSRSKSQRTEGKQPLPIEAGVISSHCYEEKGIWAEACAEDCLTYVAAGACVCRMQK